MPSERNFQDILNHIETQINLNIIVFGQKHPSLTVLGRVEKNDRVAPKDIW